METKRQSIKDEYALTANRYTENILTLNPFIEKIYTILEDKIDDTDLNISKLAQLLNISRVQLHRKVKIILGVPASEMVRNYRLNKAIIYLDKGYNSSETAFMVGFDSPSYFSKCFKKLFGKSPIQYVKNNSKNPQ